MSAIYEWDVEEVTSEETEDHEQGEVIEHWFQESYSDCVKQSSKPCHPGTEWVTVLVCDTNDSRSWAYLNEDSTLPEYFEDAYQHRTRKVPKRFHNEVLKLKGT
jgi:hypothetical protein